MGDPKHTFDVHRLTGLNRVSAPALSPCGTWIATTVQRLDQKTSSYISDLWRVAADGATPPHRLTHGRFQDRAPAFRRDGALAFISDRPAPDGDDDASRGQVWIFPPGGGEPVQLTDEPLGVSEFKFAKDGDRLIVLANVLPGVAHDKQREVDDERRKDGPSRLRYTRMPVRHWDHWLSEAAPHFIAYDENGGGRRDLTPAADREYRQTSWDLNPVGTHILVAAQQLAEDRVNSGALQLIDIADGSARSLPLASGESFSAPRFSPDGQKALAIRNIRSPDAVGRRTMTLVHLDTMTTRALAADLDRWPSPQGWTPDGAQVIVTFDAHGLVPVYAVNLKDDALTRLTAAQAGGTHSNIMVGPDGATVFGLRQRLTHPPEVFRMPLSADATPTLLSNLSGFDEAEGNALANVTSLHTTSTDGTSCQTFLLTPRGADKPAPLMFWVHGGPMSQWSDGWHFRWNPLVFLSQGYAVALPNPRGSTGEGQAFIEGIWGNTWGGQCFQDLMAVADMLDGHDAIDSERTMAMGGSFGGYMTNWIGTQTARFKCLVTHASIFSMHLFQAVTDYPAWWTLCMGGITPTDDPDAYARYSPEQHVHQWTSPTLILHGEKDYRVPISEALALFEALQRNGVDSELVIWPDENHWILKPRNIISWYDEVSRFIDRFLSPQGQQQNTQEPST